MRRSERLCYARKRPKRRYLQRGHAESARASLIENNGAQPDRLVVFPCRKCGAWHLGNKPRSQRKGLK